MGYKEIKKRVTVQEHEEWTLLSKASGKSLTDIIQRGYDSVKADTANRLRHEKHWAIWSMITDIMSLQDNDNNPFIIEAMDSALKSSINSIYVDERDPIQVEADLPATIKAFELFLEQEIQDEKIYNLIGDKLTEWDQVKTDWNL